MDDARTLVLSAQAVTKSFPQGSGQVEILHPISLEFFSGESIAILGPSGAGKSTLLHLLGLMEAPTSGTLILAGGEVQGYSPLQRAHLRNNYIGFLFQFHHLLPELDVLENVLLPRRIRGDHDAAALEHGKKLLNTIGMLGHSHARPSTLSGGEQQRVALARALMNEPKLILADEPTGNLDKESGEVVLELLFSQARVRQATTVIVTHQEDVARRADRWIRLRDGRIESISQGSRA